MKGLLQERINEDPNSLVLNGKVLSLHNSIQNAFKCRDEVKMFMANGWKHELAIIQQENIETFFRVAELLSIPRIFVGYREIVGADNVKYDDWPAIWKMRNVLDGDFRCGIHIGRVNFSAGAGNDDQAQTNNNDIFFGVDFILKSYDIETRKEIYPEPFADNMVCTC